MEDLETVLGGASVAWLAQGNEATYCVVLGYVELKVDFAGGGIRDSQLRRE